LAEGMMGAFLQVNTSHNVNANLVYACPLHPNAEQVACPKGANYYLKVMQVWTKWKKPDYLGWPPAYVE